MPRKNRKLPLIYAVLATGPLTGIAALAAPAQAATPVATAPAQGVLKQRSDDGFGELSVLLVASYSAAASTTQSQPPQSESQVPVPGETAQSPATSETAQEPRKICRRQPAITGQVRSKRVCLTAEQWKLVK